MKNAALVRFTDKFLGQIQIIFRPTVEILKSQVRIQKYFGPIVNLLLGKVVAINGGNGDVTL